MSRTAVTAAGARTQGAIARKALRLSDYPTSAYFLSSLLLGTAAQPAHLGHVGSQELTAEHLEQVVLRVARKLLVVRDECIPQLHLLVEAEGALLLVRFALDELRLEALERALEC